MLYQRHKTYKRRRWITLKPLWSNEGEEIEVTTHCNDLCGKQGNTFVSSDGPSEKKEVANITAIAIREDSITIPKRFALHLPSPTFILGKSKVRETDTTDDDTLMAHILDEIKLETEKLGKGVFGGASVTANISDEDITLPQGFSDLIANEIAEEIVVCGLDDSKMSL